LFFFSLSATLKSKISLYLRRIHSLRTTTTITVATDTAVSSSRVHRRSDGASFSLANRWRVTDINNNKRRKRRRRAILLLRSIQVFVLKVTSSFPNTVITIGVESSLFWSWLDRLRRWKYLSKGLIHPQSQIWFNYDGNFDLIWFNSQFHLLFVLIWFNFNEFIWCKLKLNLNFNLL
jgi:hypothetical protein